jgi:hypothetical protein
VNAATKYSDHNRWRISSIAEQLNDPDETSALLECLQSGEHFRNLCAARYEVDCSQYLLGLRGFQMPADMAGMILRAGKHKNVYEMFR